MPCTDALLQLSSAQAVTISAVSTNAIDLSQVRDTAGGEPLCVAITVDLSAAASGAATVNFQFVSSASASLSSPNVLAQTGPIAKTELTAGRRPLVIRIPEAILSSLPIGQRYLGLQFNVGTGPLTAGTFSATLVDSAISTAKNTYPTGFTVY